MDHDRLRVRLASPRIAALAVAVACLPLTALMTSAVAADRYGDDGYAPVAPPSFRAVAPAKRSARRASPRSTAVYSYEVNFRRRGATARFFDLLSDEAG